MQIERERFYICAGICVCLDVGISTMGEGKRQILATFPMMSTVLWKPLGNRCTIRLKLLLLQDMTLTNYSNLEQIIFGTKAWHISESLWLV